MAITIADSLSCDKDMQWHLSLRVVQKIFHQFGRPYIDLFASSETAQLRRYMSLQRGTARCTRWMPSPSLDLSPALCLPTAHSGADSGEQVEGNSLQDATDSPLLE
ncbi:uncharacterized protein LOC143291700 [Babylonia areolata]|uniref:uncharacterized protein LOC143291700 n=1 Tax=Babylonia areolata TaxID=304850 RepID=UPI003FCF8FD6